MVLRKHVKHHSSQNVNLYVYLEKCTETQINGSIHLLLFDLSFFLSKEIELNETHYKISNKDGKNMEKVNSLSYCKLL